MNSYFTTDQGLDILIFRTNIRFNKDLRQVSILFATNPAIRQWSVDREDRDKVLRIESRGLQAVAVIQLLTGAGFLCEELSE